MRTSFEFSEPAHGWRIGRAVVLILVSIVVLYGVALFIRFGGPAGYFRGEKAVQTYIATIFLTIPLNWFARRVLGVPAREMLSVVTIGAILPPTLEGIVMHWDPQFYGGDPVVMGAGAMWILFAIGVANGLALLTALRTRKRLTPGEQAPRITSRNTEGAMVTVPDSQFGMTHLLFLRFAGRPVCNLLL